MNVYWFGETSINLISEPFSIIYTLEYILFLNSRVTSSNCFLPLLSISLLLVSAQIFHSFDNDSTGALSITLFWRESLFTTIVAVVVCIVIDLPGFCSAIYPSTTEPLFIYICSTFWAKDFKLAKNNIKTNDIERNKFVRFIVYLIDGYILEDVL